MLLQPYWHLPSTNLALTAADVHVWQATLDQPEKVVTRLSLTLSADERARADRFHFDRDRRRYIVARGGLRSIIGRYLALPPECLVFDYGPHGKPRLSLPADQTPLYFNVAHSHEMALYAISLAAEVGVDIEYTQRQVTGIDQIAARFSPRTKMPFSVRWP